MHYYDKVEYFLSKILAQFQQCTPGFAMHGRVTCDNETIKLPDYSPSLFHGNQFKSCCSSLLQYTYITHDTVAWPLLTPASVSVSTKHILSHPHKGHCGTQAIALRVKCAGTPSMVRSSVAELPLRWQCRYRLQPIFQHIPVLGFVTEDR